MAKTTRRRRGDTEPTPAHDIFAHFKNTGRLSAADADRYAAPTTTKTEDAPGNQALLDRINAIESNNAELREQLRRQTVAGAPPQATTQAVNPASVVLDLSDMPDQLHNKAEYDAELQRRVAAYTQAQVRAGVQSVTSRTDDAAQAAAMWNNFKAAHPEWSAHEDVVGMVAERVLSRAVAEGLDPKRYAVQNSKLFYADIAKELSSKYGKLIVAEDEEGDEGEQPARRAAATDPDEADDDGRTAGMFGGNESGGAPTKGERAPRQGEGGLIEDLQKVQKSLGIF